MQHEPLPNYLRAHRRRVGLSQDEIAFLLGLESRTNVSRHETRTRIPRLDLALGYELILGVPVGELFAGARRPIEVAIRQRAVRLCGRVAMGRQELRSPVKLALLRRLAAH